MKQQHLKSIASVISVGFFLFLAYGSDKSKDSGDAQKDAEKVQAETKVKMAIPEKQMEFETARDKFYKDYEAAQNEIKKSAAYVESKNHTCEFEKMNGNKFDGWVGEITSLTTDQGGSEITYFTIVSKAHGRTISYKESGIKKKTEVYNKIAEFKIGDKVYFSFKFKRGDVQNGVKECFEENSVTEWGSLDAPDFGVNFTDIRAIQ